jgi:glycosyltransferase involved in cell wall biosynthesis
MTENATPLVSIVIPTYNHARFLGRALQSVLDQTYVNWEAIVIDNHSTDNTDELISGFTDPRITYLKIHNKGVIAASRNAGINAAKGEWIAFLDSDDWWTKDKLQVCFNSIDEHINFVYHDMVIVSERPGYFFTKKIKCWQVKSPVIIDLMTRGNCCATSSVVVKSILLKKIKGMNVSYNMVGAEDYNSWLRIAELTNDFKYIPKRLGFYQVHKQGVSSQKNMSAPTQQAVAEFINLLNSAQKNKFEANINYTRGRFNYLAGNLSEAKNDLLFCIKYSSLQIKLKSFIMIIKLYLK